MKRKKAILLVILMTLILTACSSTNTMPETQVETTEKGETSQKEDTGDQQSITVLDISFTIPHDWDITEEDDGFYAIHSSSDAGFGCILNVFDASEEIDSNTTKDVVYDYCLQAMGIDDSVDYELGEFKKCPAAFYSFVDKENENGPVEYEGISFIADTSIYCFTIGASSGEDHEEEKAIAKEIQDSIVIDPSVNISRYDNTSSTANAEESMTASSQSELSFAEDVIYNEHDIVINTDAIKRNSSTTTVSFIVQNNSDKDYSVSAHSWDINGVMAGNGQYGFNSVESAAGKKSRIVLEMDNEILDAYSITDISEINVMFWFYSDSFKEWNTELINVKTNHYREDARPVASMDPDYSDDVVDVWCNVITPNDLDNAESGIALIIHNKSKYNATCTIENCSVNDWSYELTNYTFDAYDEIVNNNAFLTIIVPIDKDFMEENSISELEQFEFDVHMEDDNWNYQGDLWEYSTDKITFTDF